MPVLRQGRGSNTPVFLHSAGIGMNKLTLRAKMYTCLPPGTIGKAGSPAPPLPRSEAPAWENSAGSENLREALP